MDALADIAVFVRVVERGSFTLAADDLRLSRAVVSKYLSRLEERLGARLLHRTTRRLSLTEAGAALFEASRGALERIEEAESAVAQFRSPYRGRCGSTTASCSPKRRWPAAASSSRPASTWRRCFARAA